MAQAGDRSYGWLRSAVAGFLFVFTTAAVQGQLELVSRVHPSQISETGAHAPGFIDSSLSRISMSADRRYVVFVSTATNLVPGQKAGSSGFPGFNVFLRDLVTGSTTLVSRSMSSPETTGNLDSVEAVLSADGRYVVFASYATDLAPGQDQERDPFGQDLLLYDRTTGAVTLVVQPSPAHLARNFEELRTSPNGRWIAFVSTASDLVPGQFHVGGSNVFLHDRVEKKTRLVSHSEESTTKTRRFRSWNPLLSDDGRYVAFLGHDDNNALPGRPYVFLYDRRSEALTQIGIADGAAMSADGRFVRAWCPARRTPARSRVRPWTSSFSTGPPERPRF
jgi:Tol biopolymer transport system component